MFLQMEGLYGVEFLRGSFEGTNGLGTALAEQKPILVHRDEHFRAQWGIFSCAVAPLFDHGGCLAGAVQHHVLPQRPPAAPRISSHWRSPWKPRAGSSGRSSAGVFATPGLRRCRAKSGSGLIAYDDDRRLVGACRSARSMLSLTDSLFKSGIVIVRCRPGSTIKPQAWRMARVDLHRTDGSPVGAGARGATRLARGTGTDSKGPSAAKFRQAEFDPH